MLDSVINLYTLSPRNKAPASLSPLREALQDLQDLQDLQNSLPEDSSVPFSRSISPELSSPDFDITSQGNTPISLRKHQQRILSYHIRNHA
jgi:hypothetical protein